MRILRFAPFALLAFSAPLACGNDTFDAGSTADGGNSGGDDGGGSVDGSGGGEGGTLDPTSPRNVTFADTDPTKGRVAGSVTIGAASNESPLVGYDLFWGSSDGTPIGAAITRLPKSGGDLTYAFPAGSTAPDGAEKIMAFGASSTGEGAAPAIGDGDNYLHFVDTSSLTVDNGSGSAIGNRVALTDDSLVVAGGTSFLGCKVPNGPCSFTAFPTTVADVLFDATAKMIVNLTSLSTIPALAVCELAGTDCTAKSMAGAMSGNGSAGRIAQDAKTHRLYSAYTIGASTLGISVCDEDGANCDSHLAGDNGGYTFAQAQITSQISVAIDEAGGYLLIAGKVEATSNGNKLGLVRCPLDFGSASSGACLFHDISGGAPPDSGWTPDAIVDAAHSTLLVVTDDRSDSHAALTRCALDGTGCSVTNLYASAGLGLGSTAPHLHQDAKSNLWITLASTSANVPTLLRCASDGTACTKTSLVGPAGSSTLSVNSILAGNILYIEMTNQSDPKKGAQLAWIRTW